MRGTQRQEWSKIILLREEHVRNIVKNKMVHINVERQRLVDFSFMPSLKCNLSCAHCMYDASPENGAVLDAAKTAGFISTIDFDKINSMGFYGGEISCDYAAYQRIIDMLPKEVVKFTITNGTWFACPDKMRDFLDFRMKNRMQVFISDTKFTDLIRTGKYWRGLLEKHFKLKGRRQSYPYGQSLYQNKEDCSAKCIGYTNPMRLTLNPFGKVMFCNCDGIYPVVG